MADDDYDFDYEEDGGNIDSEEKKDIILADHDDDDDQQSQRVNGQLEALRETLREAEADNERLRKEIHEKDDEIEELKAKHEEGGDNVPSYSNLMETFIKFARTNSLGCSARLPADVTEDIAIAILSEAQAKLQKATSRPPPTTTSANCDENELVQRVANLEEELRLALGAAEDIRALKAKAIQLVERIRLEKEDRLKAEGEVKSFVKKVEMLSDHIEKLMIHLKHEAAAKVKAIDQLRGSEKRNQALREDLELITRKTTAKERLIAELREGSKILEDQLRLMDEKYLELRTKLDYAREVAQKKVRNAQKTASDLRVKFALAGNQKLLDHIPLPNMDDMNNYDMTFDGGISQAQSMPSLDSYRSKKKGSSSSAKKKKKDKSLHLAQDSDESTARVLDKIRRLRGGEQEWDSEKIKKLTQTR